MDDLFDFKEVKLRFCKKSIAGALQGLFFEGNWMKKLIRLSAFIVITSFPVFVQSQTTTIIPDYQKRIDELVADNFDSQREISDLNEYGKSPLLDLDFAFFNLSPDKQQKLLSFMQDVSETQLEFRGTSSEFQNAKNDSEKKKVEDRVVGLKSKLKTLPSELRKIFGEDLYKRYGDFLVWEKLNEQDWGTEADEKKHEWQAIDKQNDEELKEAGLLDPNDRRLCLDSLYQEYKDYYDLRDKIESENQPDINTDGPIMVDGFKCVQQFLENREKRKRILLDKTGIKNITAHGKGKMGFILNEP